jgi:hypothetical protein
MWRAIAWTAGLAALGLAFVLTGGLRDTGITIGAFLTLFIFSFLYKDNPFYKFAEHLFVGVSAGYYIILNWWTVIYPNLVHPLRTTFANDAGGGGPQGFGALLFAAQLGEYRYWLLIPGLLGILLFTRFVGPISWLSRWSLAVIIGVYAGIKTTGFAQGDLVAQTQASLQPLWTGNLAQSLNNIIFTLGLLSSLVFFFFSKEHKGALGRSARLGILFLMVSFGAGYGYTVMSRVSLLIGRFQFLLDDWLHVVQF